MKEGITTERFGWRRGRPRPLLIAVDGLDRTEGFVDVRLTAFFLNVPFGRPIFFLISMGASGRSDCSLEVSWPMGTVLKDGMIPSPFRGRPRGFLGGKSLSLSSSSKKS